MEQQGTEGAQGSNDAVGIRVSVIVPVYRPGAAIDPLIASLDAQTLSQDRFEVLLCDDGSGDETAAQLAAIARDRASVRVLSLPHSGWPGTPRNAGVDAARGTYVQFVDQDDRLYPEALERLCDYADRHRSDVVVGREVGIGRPIPRAIFARDVADARLGEHPLLQMLTPHKLFRTAFLREHGIRYPDGRVRLEDHLFVMQAYLAASRISILASTPCYEWIKRAGSASAARIDPESYYPHLETVLDVVEAGVEPGPMRDRMLSHWLRLKILRRLSGRQMARYPAAYRERLLDVVTDLVARRFGPGVDAALEPRDRLRAALLRADRRHDLLQIARLETVERGTLRVTDASWTRGGGLRLAVRLDSSNGGGERADEDLGWLDTLHAEVIGGRARDSVEVRARDEDGVERRLSSGRLDVAGRAVVSIDPLRVFPYRDEATARPLVADVRRAGWRLPVALVVDDAVAGSLGGSPLLAGSPTRLARTDEGAVELRRAWPRGRVRSFVGRVVRRARSAVRTS